MAQKQQYPIRLDISGPQAKAAPRRATSPAARVLPAVIPALPNAISAGLAIYGKMLESGGELPPASAVKAAPKAAPAITTRPKSAQNVYEELNRRLGQAILGGGEASINMLQGFAPTVPAAGKPVPAKDQLMLSAADIIEQGAAQRILAARQAGDVDGVRSARDDYVRRVTALIGGDPYTLIGEEAGE